MAASASAGSLESCVRAQLFSIQVSIVDAHEQVLAIVREHTGSSGTTIQRGTKQGTKSTVGVKAPLKITAPTPPLVGTPEPNEGASCSNEVVPVRPPALPSHPPPPGELNDRDHLLEAPRADCCEEDLQSTHLESRRSSNVGDSNVVESFLVEEERRHSGNDDALDLGTVKKLQEIPSDEELVIVPGALADQEEVASESIKSADKSEKWEDKSEKWEDKSEKWEDKSEKWEDKSQSDSGSEHTEQTQISIGNGSHYEEEKDKFLERVDSCDEGAEAFELLEIWHPLDMKKRRGSVKAMLQKAQGCSVKAPSAAAFIEDISDEEEKRPWQCQISCTIHPHAMPRGCWDAGSLLLVAYDMIFIPLQLFDIPPNPFTEVMAWTTRLFWTADILASFVTGYVRQDGTIEMSMKSIARRYLLSWCLLDAVIVFADWMEILWDASGGAGYARMGKASRVIRIVRMVRLLRLVRMQQVIKLIIERIHSERVTIMADILRITTVIAGFTHIMACVWYGISVKGGRYTWVAFYEMLDRTIEIRYACALHWSFSQFTGGMDEFVPQNLEERIFAIVVFLVAFLLSSCFISSLTSSMTQLNMISSHYSQKLSTLRKYMQQNGISKKVAMRVQRNAQFALREQQRFMPEDQVVVLDIVSEPLRVEVHFEMYSAVLNVHPFFDRYIEECPQVMKKVCHSAMSMLQVSFGDIIFSPGETALQPRMFLVTSGSLHYVAASAEVFVVEERTWISEAVIWTNWMHRGQLTATRECRLCVLEAPIFHEVVKNFEHPDFDPRRYAAAFVKDLNANLTEIVDLPSKSFNYEAALGRAAGTNQPRATTRFSVMVEKVQQQGARVRRSVAAPAPRKSFAGSAFDNVSAPTVRKSVMAGMPFDSAPRKSVQASRHSEPAPRRSVGAALPRRSVLDKFAGVAKEKETFSPVTSESSRSSTD